MIIYMWRSEADLGVGSLFRPPEAQGLAQVISVQVSNQPMVLPFSPEWNSTESSNGSDIKYLLLSRGPRSVPSTSVGKLTAACNCSSKHPAPVASARVPECTHSSVL